ncbi:MAG: hypothetical protein ABSH33_06460 [Steroidobacteraceae bacterium]
MQHSFSMPSTCIAPSAKAHRSTTRELGTYDTLFVGLILWTLVHTTEALAGDQSPLSGAAARPDFADLRQPTPLPATLFPIPAPYQAADLPETKSYSAEEFRPRARSIPNPNSGGAGVDDESIMSRTTVWQRLPEYRSLNRVRVMTLWEAGGNSLSLQAGRRGDPSLQWTSRLMNRGGAPRGLLDELFSTSVGGAVGRGLHIAPRASSAEPIGKPAKSLDAAAAGAAASK